MRPPLLRMLKDVVRLLRSDRRSSAGTLSRLGGLEYSDTLLRVQAADFHARFATAGGEDCSSPVEPDSGLRSHR